MGGTNKRRGEGGFGKHLGGLITRGGTLRVNHSEGANKFELSKTVKKG